MNFDKRKLTVIIGFLAVFFIAATAQTFAQGGGKAMPNRIAFAKGKSSKTVSGTLKNDEIAEYVFGVREGQNVKVTITSTSPKGEFHAFNIYGLDDIDFATETDINYEYEFTAPATGDYEIDVSFRPAGKVRSGNYALTLTIN